MMKFISAVMLCCGIAFSTCLAAADMKIAVVDLQKIFQNYEKTKMIEMKLNQQLEVFKQYAVKLAESLKKTSREFEDARDASQNLALSPAERENKRLLAQDLFQQRNAKEKELATYNRAKQTQIKETYEKMRSEIIAEIQKAIRNKSSLEGYTLVLDKSSAPNVGVGVVIFHLPSMDITDAILRDLNRGHKTNARNPVPDMSTSKTKEKVK